MWNPTTFFISTDPAASTVCRNMSGQVSIDACFILHHLSQAEQKHYLCNFSSIAAPSAQDNIYFQNYSFFKQTPCSFTRDVLLTFELTNLVNCSDHYV